ncbi:hypothetical protein ACFL46_03865 [Candidatus Neomarinimicrobiota bacterium]
MDIKILEITDRQGLEQFVRLPILIHKNHAKWVPPLYSEEFKYFDSEKNKAFSYCDTIMALAYQDNKAVGRIMGIINHRYNKAHDENTARFSCLECFNDEKIAHALLKHVEHWAKEHRIRMIAGPMGFSDQDPEGYLVKGFDEEPTIASNFNFEYIPRFLETAGYEKDIDYVVYKVPVKVPKYFNRILKRIQSQATGYKLIEFEKRKEFEGYIKPILDLMNDTFSGHHGFIPMNEDEMNSIAKKFVPVLDPRFIKAVEVDGKLVSFFIGMPNMNAGLRKAKGRLFPFGLIHILWERKRTKQLDLLMAGIRKEYQGRGLDVLMGNAMLLSAKKAGFLYLDTHNEDETNLKVRAEMERADGELYKIYRVFKKPLILDKE